MTDIGKGDVVVAVKEMHVSGLFTGHGPYIVQPRSRAIVAGLTNMRTSTCPECGDCVGPGLILEEWPLKEGVAWCLCEWRKFGGSKDDHVRQFAEYLKAKPLIDTEVMKRLLAPGRRP